MEYVGTKEAARLLNLNPNYIAALCRKGVFPRAEHDAPGSPWRIPKLDIDHFKANRKKQIIERSDDENE